MILGQGFSVMRLGLYLSMVLVLCIGCASTGGSAGDLGEVAKFARPPLPESGVKKLKLPAPVDAMVAAVGGRYLIFHLGKLRKLAIVDVSKGEIVKYLPMGSDEILFAGGMDKLIVVARDHKIIQRWDLKSFEKELTVALDEPGLVDSLVMGASSAGPLLMLTRNGARFYNPQTLKRESYGQRDNFWASHPQYPMQVRASMDGTAFTGWTPRISPNGIRLLTLTGKTHNLRSQHSSAGYLIPSPDGTMVLTSSGVYSQELARLNPSRFEGLRCLASYHPAYFIGVKGVGPYYGRRPTKNPELSIFTSNDRQLLVTLPDIEELMGAFNGKLPLDQKVHFFPTAELLVTVGETLDELVLRRISVIDVLKKKGIDYLFATSIPSKRVKAGEIYSYTIEIMSGRGKAKVELNDGPEGAKIKKNKLTWRVPADHKAGPVSFILTLSDASGQNVFHTFTVQVENTAEQDVKKTPEAGN
ncbi:MAG: hypothetical protein CMO74_02060 [Verrucomicrobiales bacterium]|nr:hypothetical protein [Verrucomicrobiales bacterium]|tara:strand:+ start:799 stop:2214 length:1416 start_codon:yes stop_codon:yes gene_type:complete